MIVTTTHCVEGRKITGYLGIVAGEAVLGANFFQDFMAGVRDFVGGRSVSYEDELRKAKDLAVGEMQEQAAALGADAIVGVDLDYEHIGGESKSMLMVCANGTAVTLS
jgi:uncharacterized protein YbjQ (UPF0145 family)